MNFVSVQGYVDSHPLDLPVMDFKIPAGKAVRSRIYAALDATQAGEWLESEVVLYNRQGEAGRLPLKIFQPAAQGSQPSDSAFASSTVPPAAPNVITVQMNYTGTVLYLFPFITTEEITRVTLVPRARNIPVGLVNFYVAVISEDR